MSGVTTATALAVVAATTVAAGAVSAIGAEKEADAQSNALKYQAQVADNNAKIAQQQAQLSTATGEAKVAAQEQKTRAAVGAIKAAQGANNIDVDSGSTLDVQKSQNLFGQTDSATIMSNAAREAYGYETQSENFTSQAGAERAGASNAESAGDIGAASSLLGAAASVGKTYAGAKLQGGPGGSSSDSGIKTAQSEDINSAPASGVDLGSSSTLALWAGE